ncbi:flagellar export protein FliJ [Leptolyngbya sp. 15MV]|nr:flagellar export protein FliJ [Leptolyngbya sp. 15MV]
MAGAEEELATAQREVETARAALARAAVDRKGVELLRDRRRAAWLADLNRREQGELDELAVIRAAGGAGARKDGER